MTRAGWWQPAYVAIGSNLDEPRRQVAQAIARLNALPQTRLLRRSRLYLSAPLGPQNQPEFVNAAVGLLTQLDGAALMRELLEVERAMGRTRPAVRWGPRVIDLDLLLHGQSRIESAELTLPHPGLLERNFVLYPLRDIAPELQLPGAVTVAAAAQRLGDAGLSVL